MTAQWLVPPTRIAALLLTIGLSLTVAAARAAEASGASGENRAMLYELRREDLRVATIAFRLATRGSTFCPRTVPLSGMLIHDTSQYGPQFRTSAIGLFNFGQGPAVEAVVPGSPAALAGIAPGDRLAAINGVPLPTQSSPGREKASYVVVDATQGQLDKALAAGPVRLEFERAGRMIETSVSGVPGCASRVQLVPDNKHNPGADGRVVTVSTAVVADTQNDDELAFLIAHELSHNILGHRIRLENENVPSGLLAAFGAGAGKIRRTEEEADYLGLYLMAAASYDVRAAALFWKRFDRQHGWGILADRTHLNGGDRVRFLELVADQVSAAEASGKPVLPIFGIDPGHRGESADWAAETHAHAGKQLLGACAARQHRGYSISLFRR